MERCPTIRAMVPLPNHRPPTYSRPSHSGILRPTEAITRIPYHGGRPQHCSRPRVRRSDRSVLIRMPAALSVPMNKAKYNWGYGTEPEPHLGDRRLHCPRGKVIGGSSSINGLVYVRGNPLDFKRWEKARRAGATGMSCPTSGAPKRGRRAGTLGAAPP